jgi:hypothetical protein
MKRIAILGTASSGKTTLAAALAQRFGTVWVPEYLREFVDSGPRAGGGGPDPHRPHAAGARGRPRRARSTIFCDTTPLMTASTAATISAASMRSWRRWRMPSAALRPDAGDGRRHSMGSRWLMRENEEVSITINRMLMEELSARGIPTCRKRQR